MVDRLYNNENNSVFKPNISREIVEKEKLFKNPVASFYDCCCYLTQANYRVDIREFFDFFNSYFHNRFIEELKIDGINLFEDQDINNALDISQNIFNRKIQFIHKNNCVRTNNRIYLKNLDVKSEKRYWGDELEFLRNIKAIEGMEKFKKELNFARGKYATFSNPFNLFKQLNYEIAEEINFDYLSNEQMNELCKYIFIKSFNDYNKNNVIKPYNCLTNRLSSKVFILPLASFDKDIRNIPVELKVLWDTGAS